MDSKTFTNKIALKLSLTSEEVSERIKMFSDLMAQSMMEGDTISVPGFGIFEPKLKSERLAVHPSSGKRLLVPPKMSMVFKPSAVLKQKVK